MYGKFQEFPLWVVWVGNKKDPWPSSKPNQANAQTDIDLVKLFSRPKNTTKNPKRLRLGREIAGYFREIDRLVKYYSIWPDWYEYMGGAPGAQALAMGHCFFKGSSE